MSDLAAAFTNGKQMIWNSSSLELAQTCLRKYYYVMYEHWASRRLSPHVIFGAHVAKGLERFYRAIYLDKLDREEAILEVVRQALIDTWEYDDGEGNPVSRPWVSDHAAKTRANVIRTLVWYFDFFENDSMETWLLNDGSPAVELSAQFPVDNGITFSAHLDRIVKYGDYIFVQDQKTTSYTLSAHYFDGFNPHMQMSMYSFLGRAAFNAPINGVVIDAMQIAVGFTQFARGFTKRTDGELDEWYDETMYLIESVHRAVDLEFFPKNSSACFNYGGCMFRKVCARGPAVRPNMLVGEFVKRLPMSPIEKR